MAPKETEHLAGIVIDIGYHIHNELGPGLLESVYETVLATRLANSGIKVDRQKAVNIKIDGILFSDAYRVDILVDDRLVIELKAVEKLTGLHIRQTLTYVSLLQQPLGLLMNFGGESWKGSVRRIMNNKHR